jgi:gas vesicle protein
LTGIVPTLVGALIGAAVALFAVDRGFRLQRSAQQVDRADAAAVALMLALSQYADGRDAQRAWGRFGAAKGTEPPPAPSYNSVSIALEILAISTFGDERAVARRLSQAWRKISGAKGDEAAGIGTLAGAISDWRTGEKIGADLETDIRGAEGIATNPVSSNSSE